MPQKPAKTTTARQRQQEEARRNPGKRVINYDWDWFDFFTLKGGVSADNALKYATSFVADRLDDKSIPEITAQTMQELGVKPDDITRLERAFRIHQGFSGDGPSPTSDDFFNQLEGSKAPVQQKSQSPAPYQPAALEPKKPASNNPWGVDSELDRRFQAKSQLENDEALARQLQKEEEDIARGKKPAAKKQANPFASFDSPSPTATGSQRPQPVQSGNKQPLNLGAANRKMQRTPTSVVDPAQFRSAQQIRATSPATPTSAASTRPTNINALDQAFGSGAPSPRSPPAQKDAPPRPRPSAKPQHMQQQHQQQPQQTQQQVQPVQQQRQQQQQPNISTNMAPLVATPATTMAGLGGLTTNAMAAAAASGNNAQVEKLEQMARAKAQELSAQEQQLKQQQEQIRQQALFLQQQQQQLLQAQQTQKVELQLKQLKEEREKLEQKRQADALKQQVEMLKQQQEQLLKMQQMATQVRGNIAAASMSQPALSSSMGTGIVAQQQQQPQAQPPVLQQQHSFMSQPAAVSASMTNLSAAQPQQPQQRAMPLSARLPAPLVPTQAAKPITTQSQTSQFQQPQSN
ncbi:cytoskeletal protein binding protein, partial [Linderina macrospora]